MGIEVSYSVSIGYFINKKGNLRGLKRHSCIFSLPVDNVILSKFIMILVRQLVQTVCIINKLRIQYKTLLLCSHRYSAG